VYRWLVVLLAVTGCTGVQSESPTGPGTAPSYTELQGTWLLRKWDQFDVGGTTTEDLIQLGATGLLSIAGNHHFSFVVTIPGRPDRIDCGNLALHGSTLSWTGSQVETTYFVSLGGGILTLRASDPFTSDLNGTVQQNVLEELEFRKLSSTSPDVTSSCGS
jgi:hypothetical protein